MAAPLSKKWTNPDTIQWDVRLTQGEIKVLRLALIEHSKRQGMGPLSAQMYSLFNRIVETKRKS